MANLSVCPGQSGSESSMSELQRLKMMAAGPDVVSSSLRELISAYGLLPVLRSKYARFLYMSKLWLLREISIIAVLTQNYEKVPARSLSKILIAVPYYFKPARMLNAKLLASLKSSLITNPWQNTKTANRP